MALRAIGQRMAKITRPTLARRGAAFAAIVGEWAAIVGPRFSLSTLPEKLSGGPAGEGGALTIRVAGADALELQLVAEQLVARVNTFVGHRAVSRLRLIQAPLPSARAPASPAPAVEPPATSSVTDQLRSIDDPELAASLARLAIALARESDKS